MIVNVDVVSKQLSDDRVGVDPNLVVMVAMTDTKILRRRLFDEEESGVRSRGMIHEGRSRNQRKRKKSEKEGDLSIVSLDPCKLEAYRLDRLVSGVKYTIDSLYPDEGIDETELTRVVNDAFASADGNYGEREAIEWAEGFTFPPDIGNRDGDELASLEGNLAELVRRRQAAMPSRISEESVRAVVPQSDPDFDSMLAIARGIPITTAPGFIHNGAPPPLRKKYLRVAPAVNKQVYKQYLAGKILIFPSQMLVDLGNGHWSSTHWTTKKDSLGGRILGDGSSTEHGHALNGPEVKRLVEEKWGVIKHPTIDRLVQMFYRVAERIGWDNVMLWKMDLKGAFTLMSIDPDDVRLLLFELTDGLCMAYPTGMFGHTEMPTIFDVITRVLRRLSNEVIDEDSECDAYVDDLMGIGLASLVSSDQSAIKALCLKLLGLESVADDKTVFGRKLDMIGWLIDLDTRTVSISRHNFFKTLHGFFSVDETRPVKVEDLQRLASWGVRYSTVCRAMRPFAHDLFEPLLGSPRSNSYRRLDAAVQMCIKLWRCCLCMMELRGPERYSRSMSSFMPSTPDYVVEFDGSLTGVGLKIYKVNRDGEVVLWKVAGYNFPFDIPGGSEFEYASSYQNTCELIGPVLAMGILARFGLRQLSLKAVGDSKAALKWVTSERFRRGPSRNAAMCYTSLGMNFDMHFEDSLHIPGIDNVECDKLSRHVSPYAMGYDHDLVVDVEGDAALVRLVNACNPLVSNVSGCSFEVAWHNVRKIVDDLIRT
jgi:hypothetical protein